MILNFDIRRPCFYTLVHVPVAVLIMLVYEEILMYAVHAGLSGHLFK